MKEVKFTELRNKASDFFDEVEEGNTIRVLRHGRAIAEIVPIPGEKMAPAWKKEGLRLSVRGASLSRTILLERKRGP